MALEESDFSKIAEIVNQTLDARQSKGNNGGGNGGGNNNGNDGDDIAKIKADAEAKAKAESALKSAMGFNLTRATFMTDNKQYLPATIETVVKALSGRQYKSEQEEADNYRKIILDEVFESQANIDLMPESAKAKIAKYKSMADSDRVNNAGDYFELVDTFLTLKKGIAQKEFNKNGTGGGSDAYAQKFADLGKTFTNKGA